MRAALAFLTPFGPARTPTGRTLRWFPVVGALIGGAVGTVWWAAARTLPGGVPAALAVAADLGCTGLLHIDGLADSADGLLPHLERQRRLTVMAEPDIGAFGVAVVGVALLVRFAALDAMPARVALLAGVWCASRSVMVLATAVLPYARDEGLASAFLGDGRTTSIGVGAAGLLGGAALAAWADGLAGALAIPTLGLVGAAVLALGHRRLGGFTGDVLGAAAVVGETAALVVATAGR